MKVLVVAATDGEIASLVASADRAHHSIEFLTTGVGMVAAAVATSRALAVERYDVALNLGVCGTFDAAIPPGTVLHVVSDRIAELGAEDGDAFLTLDDMKLPGEHAFINRTPPASPTLARLPAVSGITVNTVHGSEQTIAYVRTRFGPQVESMEGAAFMCACLASHTPFAQIRAVSNVVERRNRASWKMAEAIMNLAHTTQAILSEL